MTPQRRAVVEALTGANLHLSAEDVFARAREVVPEISRATVYNTLNELVEMGELQEVQINPGPTLFDPNARVTHHHLVCSNCGHIYDIQPSGLEHLELKPDDRHGFELESLEIVFKGRCASCADAAREEP
jgi:Fe2+ or Zn2+ uptake regulation protein